MSSSPMPTLVKFGLLPEKHTAFFMCDIQEKFRPVMLYFEEVVQIADKLVQTSKKLGVPLIVTEQNPKGLGSTVAELDVSHATGVYSKTKFSMVIPEVVTQLRELCDGQLQCIVLFGMETHVCLEQTAAELCARGLKVHVVADASTSRSQEDRLLAFEAGNKVHFSMSRFVYDEGLDHILRKTNNHTVDLISFFVKRLRQMGCFITTGETVIFKLLGDKEHPMFPHLRTFLKSPTPCTGLAALETLTKT